LFIKRYLLEPFDELFYCCTEGLLGLAVVEDTRFIELCLAAMPLNDEFIFEEYLVADNQFHEGRCEFNLLWVAPYEEKYDSLEAMLNADLAILPNQLQECLLIFFPIFNKVAVGTKKPTDQDPIAILS